MAGIDLGKMKEPPHDTPMHTHPHFDMGCDCADDQIPVFSKVGRGLRGDSAKLELVEDGDLSTYVKGLTYDAATGAWSTDWISQNINAGRMSMHYTFFNDDNPKTFTMTFKLDRPGRDEWTWTTPRIPYVWDDLDPSMVSFGSSQGLFVRDIKNQAANSWIDKMILPLKHPEIEGSTERYTRDELGLPPIGEPYTNPLTWGVMPTGSGSAVHGDIPVLSDVQEAQLIGITEAALHDLLRKSPELMSKLAYTLPDPYDDEISGDTILQLFTNVFDDVYGRLGRIEAEADDTSLYVKTYSDIFLVLVDRNSFDTSAENLMLPSNGYIDSGSGLSSSTPVRAWMRGDVKIMKSLYSPTTAISIEPSQDGRAENAFTPTTDVPTSTTPNNNGLLLRKGQVIVPCTERKRLSGGWNSWRFKMLNLEELTYPNSDHHLQAPIFNNETLNQAGALKDSGTELPVPFQIYVGVGNIKQLVDNTRPISGGWPWVGDAGSFPYIFYRNGGWSQDHSIYFDYARPYVTRYELGNFVNWS